jgi:hypothetical protein
MFALYLQFSSDDYVIHDVSEGGIPLNTITTSAQPPLEEEIKLNGTKYQ